MALKPIYLPEDNQFLVNNIAKITASPMRQAMQLSRSHYRFFENAHKELGDTFILRVPNDSLRVVLGHPEDIKIMTALKGDDIYSADAGIMANLGEKSVMFLDGQPHRRARALVAPPINGKTLDGYADEILAITHDVIDSWQAGSDIYLLDELITITLRVIGRCILGFDDSDQALTRVETWLDNISKPALQLVGFMVGFNNMRRFLERKTFDRLEGIHSWLPYPGMNTTAMKADIVRGLIKDIKACRATADSKRIDVLALLANARDEDGQLMDPQDIVDQLLLFFSAGHETTAKSSAWALLDILQRPNLLASIASEVKNHFPGNIDNPRSCMDLPLLNSVIKESMRLSPVTTMLQREITRPVELRHITLPTGTTAAPCNFIAQRHPDYWDNPLTFEPERFIDFKPLNEAYCPFGLGVRKCLGVSMAYLEMPIILAAILKRTDFVALPFQYTPPEFSGITLAPKGGVKVHIKNVHPH